jgi:hypothetical protein
MRLFYLLAFAVFIVIVLGITVWCFRYLRQALDANRVERDINGHPVDDSDDYDGPVPDNPEGRDTPDPEYE